MSNFLAPRKSALAALAVSLAGLGSSTMPAAALPGLTSHFIGGAGITELPPTVRQIIPDNTVHIPTPEKTVSVGGQITGSLKPPIGLPPIQHPLPHGIDDVCPNNPLKCSKTAGASQGSGAGGASAGSPSSTGGGGPIQAQLPPVVIPVRAVPVQVPTAPVQPVAARPQPIAAAQPPANQVANGATSSNVDAPCSCLTKQYLDDGSILFRDICTKEAALVTQDELKAQNQAQAPTK